MEDFTAYGNHFRFDPEVNKEISNFKWYIDYLKTERWETFTFETFRSCANENKIALDIGAWIGSTSIWLSRNFKEVYSFEPDPIAFQALAANIETNGIKNVNIFNKAIYKKETTIGIGLNPQFAHEGLGSSTTQIHEFGGIQSVETTTFENLSRIIDFSNVGLVKVDIEGAEEHIISSLCVFGSKHNWKVLIEVHNDFMSEKGRNNFESILELYSPPRKNSVNQIFLDFGGNILV
jgi:FkbM family methyltransferase